MFRNNLLEGLAGTVYFYRERGLEHGSVCSSLAHRCDDPRRGNGLPQRLTMDPLQKNQNT